TIQVAGAIGIEKPTEPAFDLALTARGARVLNNQLGTAVADADLTVEGPFEAVRIAGTAHIREGAFYIPESNPELIDLSDPGLENALARIEEEGTEVPEPNPLLANLGVNVTVQIA